MKIHHIGYLVKSIEKAMGVFESLGYKTDGDVVYDQLRDVSIVFMKNGNYTIELVSPQSENSSVYKTIKKIGNTPYHICYECNNVEKDFDELRDKGFIPASSIEPAVAIDGKSVCFLFNREVGLIELVQE